jgi:hypothetical protein
MNSEQILFKEFDSLRVDLIKAYDAKGMRASGKWADSLEIEVSPLSAIISGLDYTQQLETGRGANNGSSGKSWNTTLADIEQWIKDKGITPREQNMKVSTLAYLIARKIWREGWNRQGYGGVELISEVVTDARIQSIINKVGEVTMIEYTTEIIKSIKNI